MANILSMQSHVAFGYVGNKAAVFPMQRLGHDVINVNTVQFSNHTGYGSWTGDIMSIEHIDNIFKGLDDRQVLDNLDAVLTGYLGDKALGEVLLKWLDKIKAKNPNLLYCCDPVIGDVGRGVFVRPGVPEFFQNQALSYASILTPNQFELTYLTGIEINTLDDALKACQILHVKGVQTILVTSLTRNGNEDNIEMLVSNAQETYLIATPKLNMPIAPNGSGDMTAAVFTAKFLETQDLKQSLEHTAATIYAVFLKTQQLQQRELAIIQAQDEIVEPRTKFVAHKL
ncbi:MAG: pyridoxal kinase PdxY [Proteobacteria bacterium]|nr:MAG: pyridoxal kinase PdxY [Pseudomonadota bacterium]